MRLLFFRVQRFGKLPKKFPEKIGSLSSWRSQGKKAKMKAVQRAALSRKLATEPSQLFSRRPNRQKAPTLAAYPPERPSDPKYNIDDGRSRKTFLCR